MKSLLVAILALGLVGCGPREPTEFERYKQACYNKGGAVSTVEVGVHHYYQEMLPIPGCQKEVQNVPSSTYNSSSSSRNTVWGHDSSDLDSSRTLSSGVLEYEIVLHGDYMTCP